MELFFTPGVARELPDGTTVTVKRLGFKVPIAESNSETALHEAGHAAGLIKQGRTIHAASIIPGPGYGGFVAGDHNALSTVIPYALGLGGVGSKDAVGSDLWLLHQQGIDPDALVPAARAFIARNKTVYRALATGLDHHGELSGAHAKDIVAKVEEGAEAEIEVVSKNGDKKRHRVTGLREPHLPIPISLINIQEQHRA